MQQQKNDSAGFAVGISIKKVLIFRFGRYRSVTYHCSVENFSIETVFRFGRYRSVTYHCLIEIYFQPKFIALYALFVTGRYRSVTYHCLIEIFSMGSVALSGLLLAGSVIGGTRQPRCRTSIYLFQTTSISLLVWARR
jgi:hypothetical protein